MLLAVRPPETLVLTADVHLAGVKTLLVTFLALYGSYQFGFVHLAALDTTDFSNGFDLGHIHV